ncbi:MAG: hypothetical protein JSS12_04495, partial [Verrucomicrobia bacterium]|nr:hypothetical protein [Verrucomicrobiota bacterium]
ENGVPLEQIISLIMTQALKQQSVGGIIEKVAPKDLLDKLPIPIPFK